MAAGPGPGITAFGAALAVALLLLAGLPVSATEGESPTWRNDYTFHASIDTPQSVHLMAGGDLAVVAGKGGTYTDPAYVEVLDATTGESVWKDQVNILGANEWLEVAASDEASTLVVPEVSDAADVLHVYRGPQIEQAWTHPILDLAYRTDVDVSDDGSRILLAEQINDDGPVEVTVFDAGGTVVWNHILTFAQTAEGQMHVVDMSDDGDRVMVSLSTITYVLDAEQGIVATIPHVHCCVDRSADFSEDGQLVALGDPLVRGEVHVYAWDPLVGLFLPAWDAKTDRNSVREVRFSEDGSVLAVGANNASYPEFDDGRVLAFDTATQERLWTYEDYGFRGKLDDLALSDDGSRVVAAASGSLDDETGDVLTVLDGATGSVVTQLDGTDGFGSIRDVDTTEDGRHVLGLGSSGHPYTGQGDRILFGLRDIP